MKVNLSPLLSMSCGFSNFRPSGSVFISLFALAEASKTWGMGFLIPERKNLEGASGARTNGSIKQHSQFETEYMSKRCLPVSTM